MEVLMRVSNEADISDVLAAFHWVGSIIGKEFDDKTARQQPQFRRDRIVALHFLNNFHLEWLLAAAREYYANKGQLPPDCAFDPLYAFVVSAHRIFAHLPSSANSEFASKLRGFITGPFGIRPFAYELTMAMHLMSKGWDVVFADIEKVGNFDFLAGKGGFEIEMECKTTSGDSGRQIHRFEMSRLGSLIEPALGELADVAGSHFLIVTIPSKLESSDASIRLVGEAVVQAARERANAANSHASVAYSHLSELIWSGPHDDGKVRQSCEERFGDSNLHIHLHGRPTFSVVIAAFRSERPDTVIKTLTQRAKEAADQCSGTRPAIIALNLVDPISRTELQGMLETSNGLHAIAAGIFEKEKRAHVDTIAFTVPPTPEYDEVGYTTIKGDAMTLYNPKPRFHSPLIRDLFRPASTESVVPTAD
jgi:hypothetical protein